MQTQTAQNLRRFMQSEDAASGPEYAIMLSLIVIVAVSAISGIGQTVGGTFAALDDGVVTAMP